MLRLPPEMSDARFIMAQVRIRQVDDPGIYALISGIAQGRRANFIRRALEDAVRTGALTSAGFALTAAPGDRERHRLAEIEVLRRQVAEQMANPVAVAGLQPSRLTSLHPRRRPPLRRLHSICRQRRFRLQSFERLLLSQSSQ